MPSRKIDLLKLQLKSAIKRKFVNEKVESKLRNTEHSINDEISILKNEIDLLTDQVEVLTKSISEVKYQKAMIKICNVSEQQKFQHQIDNLDKHKKGFDDFFITEQTLLQLQQDNIKAKEAEVEDLKKKELEIQELQRKKVAALENECEAIESECNVLKKRNKAIMLQLRRKLLETDEIRRELIKHNNKEIP